MNLLSLAAASAALFLAVQGLPAAAQSDDAEQRRSEWFHEYVQSSTMDVTRAARTNKIAAPLHISDDAEYRQSTAFQNRPVAGAHAVSAGASPWGPLHISEDDE